MEECQKKPTMLSQPRDPLSEKRSLFLFIAAAQASSPSTPSQPGYASVLASRLSVSFDLPEAGGLHLRFCDFPCLLVFVPVVTGPCVVLGGSKHALSPVVTIILPTPSD